MSDQDAGNAEQEDGNFFPAENTDGGLCLGHYGREGWS